MFRRVYRSCICSIPCRWYMFCRSTTRRRITTESRWLRLISRRLLYGNRKIEFVIDEQQNSLIGNCNRYIIENDRKSSSSDRESQYSAPEDEDESRPQLLRRTTMGNGPPESVFDWTTEFDLDLSNQNTAAFSRKHWRLLQCQNGLRIFEELLEVDFVPKSCSRAMKVVGVMEANCEEIFELVMSMDATRFEWDCSFQYGSLVEEVDGHTAILYHRLQLDWFPTYILKYSFFYIVFVILFIQLGIGEFIF